MAGGPTRRGRHPDRRLRRPLPAWSSSGTVVVAAVAVLAALVALPAGPASAGPSQPSAATLYRDAMASTKGWYVHYQSSSTQSKTTLEESGDAGPASGTQLIHMGTGSSLTNTATIDVIGGTTFLKGNASGLEALAGLSATEAAEAAGQWIQFCDRQQCLLGRRRRRAFQGPGHRTGVEGPPEVGAHEGAVDGIKVDAIKGTQTLQHKSVPVVLYVRAKGTHVPVEEDSLNAHGQRTKAEHITYSSWGETVRPKAPQATISIGHTNSV